MVRLNCSIGLVLFAPTGQFFIGRRTGETLAVDALRFEDNRSRKEDAALAWQSVFS
jgi:hypothetical protein